MRDELGSFVELHGNYFVPAVDDGYADGNIDV
jgi:hypothetical protein